MDRARNLVAFAGLVLATLMASCGDSSNNNANPSACAIDGGCPGSALGDAGALSGDGGNLAMPSALIGLTTSIGTLSPAFAPTTTMYTTQVGLVLPTPFTVTPTAGAPLTTTISVNGAAVKSGTPSAPIALSATAPTPVDIAVTPMGATAIHFTIVVSMVESASTYIKASNTLVGQYFGVSIALSGDTLAVGATNESSTSTGINGDQTNTVAGLNSGAVYVFVRMAGVWWQQAYVKASNTRAGAYFGVSVALSGDTLAVGADGDSSGAAGINGNQSDTSAPNAGAAYVFTRTGSVWAQQAYLKAAYPLANAQFGKGLALLGDTLAVGAPSESSGSTGINGAESNTSAPSAGATYVFTRTGGMWSQQAYVKATNTRAGAEFGYTLALSGETLAVGAPGESSAATGINGNQSDGSAGNSGAAYVFTRTGNLWSQQAYVKASNSRANARFGTSVVLSGDTLAVGAPGESSGASGIDGNQTDTSAAGAGAAYVFTRTGTAWTQQAYVKASNPGKNAGFGLQMALDGDSLAVGALFESSAATGVGGNQSDMSSPNSGATYLFSRTGTSWAQRAYVKALNVGNGANFGVGVALSGDTLAVSAPQESSAASGINGNAANTSAPLAGAVYVYR